MVVSFLANPLCAHAVVVPPSRADEVMCPGLEIHNRKQMASAFSEHLILTAFIHLGCISLGHFLILRIVKIIF